MSTKLHSLINLALKTFANTSTSSSSSPLTKSNVNYSNLIHFLSSITSTDVHFHLMNDYHANLDEFNKQTQIKSLNKFLINKFNNAGNKQEEMRLNNVYLYLNTDAPVLYMKIYETQQLTLSVFVIRKGASIPLHNHPLMNGLIKVLYGYGHVNAYSKLDSSNGKNAIRVKHELSKELNQNSELLVLTPDKFNIHEICASESSDLAFLDLITPSYDSNTRNCEYYRLIEKEEEKEEENGLVHIEKLNACPDSYFCDTIAFAGPDLENEVIN